MNGSLILAPPPDRGLVRVSAAPHPFKAATVDRTIREGQTVAEMLVEVQADPILRRHAVIFVDDWQVPREFWHQVRPKAGRLVTVRVVPEGGGRGGKPIFRVLLSIAVIGAALFLGPTLGAALAPGLSTGIQTAIGTAAISVAGNLLVNAIAPIRPPSFGNSAQNEAESPSYFLDQARNTFRPYAPVPVVFGRHRVVPPLGAAPVTEVVGDANHLRMIVVWGYGPLRVTDIKIGETPISQFADVRIETREGRPGDAPITLYPDDIDQQNLSVTLSNDNGENPGDWFVRRSAADADELSIDISLPRGLAEFNKKSGKRESASVAFDVQYRRLGTSMWVPLSSVTAGTTGAPSNGRVTLESARTQPIRHGLRWDTPARGQYDIRVRRVTPIDEDNDRLADALTWTALRTITDRPPISFPENLAVTAIDIRASDQLSEAVDDVNGIVEAEAQVWNGTAWSAGYTRNAASAFRLALQSPARRKKAPDSEIDLDALEEFSEFCAINGYNFDHIQDTRKGLWELLSDICAVARASPTQVDGKWSVVVDTGTQQVAQHFTPVNSANFKITRGFADPPDGFRVSFPNEEANWRRDERIVYNDGFTDANAQTVPSVEPVGITNNGHAYKFARFQLAQVLLRREVWEFEADMQYLVARRGSRITAQHDVLAVGLASAYVESVIENDDGDATAVVLDTPIQIPEADQAYSAKVRTRRNAHIVRPITQTGGPDTEPVQRIDFATPIEGLGEGDLVTIGESGRETIDGLVTDIRSKKDMTARIVAVPYQAGIYGAETGPIPAFDSKIAGSFGVRQAMAGFPPVSEFSVTEEEAGIRAYRWVPPARNDYAGVRIRYAADASTAWADMTPVANGLITESPHYSLDPPEGTWTFECRAVSSEGEESTGVRFTETFGAVARGLDGTDGNGIEDIFAATDSLTLTAAQRPSNDWGFDQPATAGGLTWYDGLAGTGFGEDKPYLWRATRRVPGTPATGADIDAEWTRTFEASGRTDDPPSGDWEQPVIVGRWAIDGEQGPRGIAGQDGQDGQPGADGADGAEGQGVEYVFCQTAKSVTSIPANQRPDNSWAYDRPGTVGNLQWTDGAPTLTDARPKLWRSERAVPGAPSAGDAKQDDWGDWSVPVVVGELGRGVEYIFARTATANVPAELRPDNAWGFDQGGTRTTGSGSNAVSLAWTDAAPNITEALPYLWRAEREIAGIPAVGAAVSANWSAPTIVGRFGVDGRAGDPGDPGEQVEYIFARTATTTAPSAPSNSWGFDEPQAPWSDGAPGLTEAMPYLWRTSRRVPANAAVGAAVSADWRTPVIVGHFGSIGAAGADGDDGAGIEFIFSVQAEGTTPASPSNSWGFDTPGVNSDGTGSASTVWFDGAPNVTAARPILWMCQRRTAGFPTVGAAVSANWTAPRILARRGPDGQQGPAGQRGQDGQRGPQGPQGPQGPAGQDAPTVTGYLDRINFSGVNTTVTGTGAAGRDGTPHWARWIRNIEYTAGPTGADGSRSGNIAFTYTGQITYRYT